MAYDGLWAHARVIIGHLAIWQHCSEPATLCSKDMATRVLLYAIVSLPRALLLIVRGGSPPDPLQALQRVYCIYVSYTYTYIYIYVYIYTVYIYIYISFTMAETVTTSRSARECVHISICHCPSISHVIMNCQSHANIYATLDCLHHVSELPMPGSIHPINDQLVQSRSSPHFFHG